VRFEIKGPGSILAVSSSNPLSTESFKQPLRKAYQGRCIAILESGTKEGNIILKAFSDELQPAEIVISNLRDNSNPL
jgi:beta-galactosidase